MKYEIQESQDIQGNKYTVIVATDEAGEVRYIPNDPANSDYAAYLASLEAPQA
jgi:hypothetical protein